MTSFILRNQQVRQNCIEAIRALPEWKLWEVEIGTPTKTRQQEKYLHMLWGVISNHTGYPLYDVKDRVKLVALPPRFLEVRGETHKLPAHSSTLNKEEYSRLIDATLMIFDQMEMTAPVPEYYGYKFRGQKTGELS